MRNVWTQAWSWVSGALLGAGALNARQPLVAWEAAWDEAEALQASGQLWNASKEEEGAEKPHLAVSAAERQPQSCAYSRSEN